MSGLTSLTDTFGDGVHTFKLPFAQLEELQEKTGVGPAVLLNRMVDGTWRVGELRETLRLALIGGGMTPAEALVFVRRYVEGQPLAVLLSAAASVLAVTINGRTPDKGKSTPANVEHDPIPDGSTSPASDAPRPSSA